MVIRRRPMISATVNQNTIRFFNEMRSRASIHASRAIDEGVKMYYKGLKRRGKI